MRKSVCMATYNGAKYIEEQLNSILPQLLSDDEIIISDDYSSDNTLEIISNIADSRIKVFKNELGKGYTNNFINAINKSNNELIFLSDQDDVWMNNKVELCLKYIYDGADMVISDSTIVNQDLEIIDFSFFKARGSKEGLFQNIKKAGYLGCNIAFKRTVVNKIFPYPSYINMIPYDLWIGICGMCFYKVKWLDTPLIYYRRHGENTSDGGISKSKNSFLYKLNYRIVLIFLLIKRFFK